MAFDFLGTFNKSQLDRFLAFARTQLPLIDARIQHLSAELVRVGSVSFRYEQGVPKEFVADSTDSYLGKLLTAYEVQGGNPFYDLRARTKNDPVYALRGSEATPVQYMSNGEVIGQRGLADATSAELMRSTRTWLNDTVRGRFDRLERKIRRMLDYADELQDEIDNLELIKQAAESEGSFENYATQLTQLISDPNYRAIFDDGGKDPFGLTSYAPFSSYDIVESTDPNVVARQAESPQRQNTGFVGPGEVGTEATTAGEVAATAEEELA